jgi:hypothetical protein
MNSEKKFWRLVGDYERLTSDETVALREVNLAALARLQEQKSVVSDAVLELAAQGGMPLPPDRFERLMARQKANLAITQEQLARLSCERQNLTTAGQRLSHVGRAYKHDSGSASALLAKG